MTMEWETYEEVAVYLLNQFSKYFGINCVTGSEVLEGLDSGTKWTIDGKGISTEDGGVFIVECKRRTTSKLNQESLGGLSYRISDTRSKGGLIVSPLGLQKGAKLVSESNNIVEVKLRPNSNNSEYLVSFLNKVCIGIVDTIELSVGVSSITLTKVR